MNYDAATQTVSWTPVPGQAGPASFDVLASNALDSENLTINIDVDGPMVNPPTSSNTSVSTDEDVDYTFAPANFPFADVDNDNFAGIRVVSLPVNGSLAINGVGAVSANDIVPDVTTLVYTPLPDANGTPYTSFTFKVRNDIGEESVADYIMEINVSPVNDLPVGADALVTTDEDVPYTFQPGNFTFNDIEGANFDGIRVVSLPGEGVLDAGGAVTAGQVIADVTTLDFNPGPDENGAPYTTFTFKVRSDDGQESQDDYTMTINVSPVNDLPEGGNVSVLTDEDVPYTFQPGNFTFSDVDGDSFAGIRVVSLPGEGVLDAGGAVTAGQVIADVTTLEFVPVQDANGTPYTTFTFKVRSDDGQESQDDYTMTINVSPVNDLPEGGNVSVLTDEDVPYTFQPGNFTFSDVDGDSFAGIRVVSLPVQGALDAGGAVTAGQVIGDVTTLEFVPVQDANGAPYTTFTFKVRSDDGQESQDDYTMTINVSPVNDLPEGGNVSVLTDEDVPYTFQPGDFTFTDVDGDNFAGIRVVSLPGEGALDAGGAVSAGAIIANVATLDFNPDMDENGIPYTTFTFKVRSDDGQESQDDYTMTINVNAINDPPSFIKGPDQVVNEDAGPQTVNAWATALDDGDPDETQSLEFEILNNTNPGLFAVQPAVNAGGGTLTYEPALNENGMATITVRIKDTGSNTPPNINIGNTETFDITVTPVNDEPQVNTTNGKTQYLESSGMSFVNVDGAITVSDVDNANFVSGSVAFTDTYIQGEDALSFVSGSTGVTGVFDENTGVLALTGNRPVNQYQIALSSVLYVNSAGNNPTAGDREITFSVSDGDLTGANTKIVTVVTEKLRT